MQQQNNNLIPLSINRQGRLWRGIKILLLSMAAVLAVAFSPLFAVSSITTTDLECLTKEELCSKIGLKQGMNVFLFSKSQAVKELTSSPYLSSVNIRISFPAKVHIEVEERKVRGYVPYMGSYLYIDEFGRVLDVQKGIKAIRPVVQGLEFNHFQVGEILPVKNKKSFDIIVKMAQLMTKYQLLDTVVRIDVKDPQNIYAYVNHIDIMLGDIRDCDEKVRTMSAIIQKIPEEDRGTLDLRDMSKPIVFQYLT